MQTASVPDNKTLPLSADIRDKGGEPITSLSEIPGATLEVTSSDEDVCGVEMQEGGLVAFVTTKKRGKAVITFTPGGSIAEFADPDQDQVEVTVEASAPASLNVHIGEPIDET